MLNFTSFPNEGAMDIFLFFIPALIALAYEASNYLFITIGTSGDFSSRDWILKVLLKHFSERGSFFKRDVTKSRGRSTTTTNAEVKFIMPAHAK